MNLDIVLDLEREQQINNVVNNPVDFLHSTVEGADDAAKLLPYFAYRYHERLALLWEQAESLKEQLKKVKGEVINRLMGQSVPFDEDPLGKKKYSFERAKEIVHCDSAYQELHARWLNADKMRRECLGYLSALELKASFIPGFQGRMNAWLRAEMEGQD